MRLSDFDYHLPPELIAQYPLPEREKAKLLVVNRAAATLEHRIFSDIPEYLRKNDLLVLNDTKVVNCRLKGRRATGGKVEIFILAHKGGSVFDALIKPGRLKLGERISFKPHTLECEITGKNEVRFFCRNLKEIYACGQVPLPPYIKREPEKIDSVYYQTVYARKAGSVASPTAGLHFTRPLLSDIKKKGVLAAYLTLHVGLATFKPVSCEDIRQHAMGREYFSVPGPAVQAIKRAREKSGRIIAVGTTSCRTLETFAKGGARQGFTDLFIYPGYEFKAVDCLVTNFHLPKTTLFMLVCAFAGEQLAQKAYAAAVKEKYRFYSYGDAMLII